MSFLYVGLLLFSLSGMAVLDKKYNLALFSDSKRTLLTLAIGMATFVVWDIFGISLGIFFSGQSDYMTGWYLGPEFPIEEIFFLLLLCYFTLIIYLLSEKQWRRT